MLRSPIGPCVRVKWSNSVEFLPIHPEHKLPFKFETVEYCPEFGGWLLYRPNFKKFQSAKEVRYEITYVREEHPELQKLDINWGTSTITIDKTSKSVRAYWAGAKNDHDDDGWARAWLVAQGERKRANARPTIRNQSQLRDLLLATDRVCAISGEGTPSVLECAHIVAVENGGFEVYGNAILLRADLHCLYDSRVFEISPKGEIVVPSKGLSEYYHNLLKGKKLDERLTARVVDFLAQRQTTIRRSK